MNEAEKYAQKTDSTGQVAAFANGQGALRCHVMDRLSYCMSVPLIYGHMQTQLSILEYT